MDRIDATCKQVVNSMDGAVACGVLDLDTGEMLGIHTMPECTQELNEATAVAAMDLFRGPSLGHIGRMVRAEARLPEPCEDHVHEVHVTSEHGQRFAKTIRDGKAVMMVVTRKTTILGMGWAQLKATLPQVEPLVP